MILFNLQIVGNNSLVILFTNVKESFDSIIFDRLSKGRVVLILGWYDYLNEVRA